MTSIVSHAIKLGNTIQN